MAHILLAEDDESLRKFLAQALVRAGHDVTDFGDGSEAWECLKGYRFDLLLTDIVMPGMSGTQLADRIREVRADLPVLFMSGYTAGHGPGGQEMPTDDSLLHKPFDRAALLDAMHRTLTSAVRP